MFEYSLSLLTSGLFLPWAINPTSVPLPWFYFFFHACSSIFSCIFKHSQLTQRRFGYLKFYYSHIFVRHKHEDSRHKDMFSFCVAEFPQFVNVPIPVHLHIIPGNRVRLPFTPLPRHQWSHASESKTTLSNLCFSLLVKSFTIFVANISNKKLLIGSFIMTLHTLVKRWSNITLFKIDGQWI